MLEDAFYNYQESFLEACSADGTLVGFCSLAVIERNCGCWVRGTNSEADKLIRNRKRLRSYFCILEAIDINGWTAVLTALKADRCRLLEDLDNIWRKSLYFILLLLLADIYIFIILF